MTFADKIKNLRNSKFMSLEQLSMEFSRKYDSKISKSSISRWENNKAKPDIDDANIYADFFNVSLDWLMDRQAPENTETIAAHIDDDVTEEEMAAIREYIELVKSQRR